MENTLTISEIKRRGMSAISDHLRAGPTHIVKRNKMAAEPTLIWAKEQGFYRCRFKGRT